MAETKVVITDEKALIKDDKGDILIEVTPESKPTIRSSITRESIAGQIVYIQKSLDKHQAKVDAYQSLLDDYNKMLTEYDKLAKP